jgi:hypothetical protein
VLLPGGGGADSDGMRTDISMGASSSRVDCSDAGCDSDTDSEEEDDETESADDEEEEEDDDAAAATAKHRATGDTHACIESRSISRSTTGCTHEARSPASNCELNMTKITKKIAALGHLYVGDFENMVNAYISSSTRIRCGDVCRSDVNQD